MAKDRLSGKLVVILHADVADSTALVQQDQALAHARIRDSFKDLGDAVDKWQGRVLERRGDALLAEFSHAADAVTAALAFQADHALSLDRLEDDLRPRIRIGITMGEVVVADDTVTGAGVVQAQRVEQLAQPDGVCITAAIHEALSKQLPFQHHSLGEQVVKGFDHPLHVYRVELSPGAAVPVPTAPEAGKPLSRHQRLIGGTVLLLAILAAGFTFIALRQPQPTDQVPAAEPVSITLPDKPSIAVLPFTNLSDDSEQDYFADGMTEDLITDLSKISGLFVISRNSVFTYKGRAVKISEVARELAVRYVMEGSVRRAGNQVRVNAQLIDASTGGHVWAERYDGSYDDVFALQDRITGKIVTTLAVRLTQGEQERIGFRETGSTEAYDVFLKGWEQYLRQTPESYRRAIILFKRAAELDPGYSRAYAAISLTFWQAWKSYWHVELGYLVPHDLLFDAESYLAKAMENPTPLALQISTSMHAQGGRHGEAIAEGERALAMDPNNADGYVALAGALNLAGQPERALPLVEQAIRLNPHYPTSYLYELGLARFGTKEYARAAAALERAVTLNPDDRWSSRLLVAILGHLDRSEEAADIIDRIEESWRGFDPLSVRGVTYWYPFKKSVDREHLAAGLRKAGIPD